MIVGSDLHRHWRASCSSTRLVNTPLQVNLAPSVIKSRRAFSPSRLMWVTFRRSITSARPRSWERAEFHVLRSSAFHGATNLPSITSLSRLWLSTTEIFIINRRPDLGETAIQMPKWRRRKLLKLQVTNATERGCRSCRSWHQQSNSRFALLVEIRKVKPEAEGH